VLPDEAANWDKLNRSNVAAWAPVVIARESIDVVRDDLVTPRESVAATHRRIKACTFRNPNKAMSDDLDVASSCYSTQPPWQAQLLKSHPDIASRHGSIFACGEESGS